MLRLPADAAEGEGVELRLTSAGTSGALLALGASLKIELKDDDPVVVIDVGDGAAKLSIKGDGTVTLTAAALAIDGGEVSLKGTTIKIEADGDLTLKGATINLN